MSRKNGQAPAARAPALPTDDRAGTGPPSQSLRMPLAIYERVLGAAGLANRVVARNGVRLTCRFAG